MMRAPTGRKPPVIAGPEGHPFHPILVTIPIGAWVASLVFDIASRVATGGSQMAVQAAYWLIGIGVTGAVLAALFGLMDLTSIARGTRAFATGITHMILNLGVTAAFAIGFYMRHQDEFYEQATVTTTGQLILSAAALGVLVVSGFLGGMMAYRYGVRVATARTQMEGTERRVA